MNTSSRTIRCGSALLIIENDRILLGRRAKEPNFGRWVLPGGKIEYGETHEAAAIREAREELGLLVELGRLAGKGVYDLISTDEHRMIVYTIARRVGGTLRASSDISEARFFTKEQLATIDLTPIVIRVLQDESWIT